MYYYGMKLRGFSPMCQPMDGLVDVKDDATINGRHYWNILCYSRELSGNELKEYELDRLDQKAIND